MSMLNPHLGFAAGVFLVCVAVASDRPSSDALEAIAATRDKSIGFDERYAALKTLVQRREPDLLQRLLRMVKSVGGQQREDIVREIGDIGDPNALPVLIELRSQKQSGMTADAIRDAIEKCLRTQRNRSVWWILLGSIVLVLSGCQIAVRYGRRRVLQVLLAEAIVITAGMSIIVYGAWQTIVVARAMTDNALF